MAYIFLLLAVICFSVQVMFSKGYQIRIINGIIQTLIFIFLLSLGILFEFLVLQKFQFKVSLISAVFAFAYAVLVIVCQLAIIKALSLGKIMIVTLYSLIGGVILPFFYGIWILDEKNSIIKMLAIVMICISFILLIYEKKTDPKNNQPIDIKKRILFFFLCLIIFITNGFVCIILKAHQFSTGIVSEKEFLILTSFFSCFISLILIIIYIISNKKTIKSLKKAIPLNCLWFIGGYAFCNGTGNMLSMISAKSLPSSIQFPMVSGGIVVLTAILSLIIYKEKLAFLNYISIFLTIISLIILSI